MNLPLVGPLAALAALLALACGGDASPPAAGLEDAADAQPDEDAAQQDAGADAQPDDDDAAPDAAEPPPPAPRAPGARTPLSSRCDPMEPHHCFLPWPSNRLVAADPTTPTGLRLALADDVLPEDEPLDALRGDDGFSRVSPIVLPAPRDAAPGATARALRVFVAEPGPSFGRELQLRTKLFAPTALDGESALVGYVSRPMAPATEHLVVAMRLESAVGEALAPHRLTRVALGLEAPETAEEQALAAYHAPARALLAETDVVLADVARVWDFTTRSAEDPRRPLLTLAEAAREAVDSGTAGLVVDSFALAAEDAAWAAVLKGRVTNLPEAGGAPFDAPFRVLIPRGSGDYRVVFFGHGAGGDVNDPSFDALITGAGAAKVGVEVEGWRADDIGPTIALLEQPVAGSDRVTAGMMRAQARIAAIQRALAGPLAELLAAPVIAEVANPAAGRRPTLDTPIWAGGSLGGVTGLVYASLEPTIVGGVLNVPGAAFTHWLGQSILYDLLAFVLANRYPTTAQIQLVSAMAQNVWDRVDGAVWADRRETRPIFAVQISIGDPVMPNIGSEMVAASLDAVQLGVPVSPIADLAVAPEEVRGRSAVTQFIAPGTDPNAIHGFTIRNTNAARAAQQQFIDLVATLWARDPVIRVPTLCLGLATPGRCDFSGETP
jgi:hypothetical protein